jgi:DNA-directed RNA polymerase specialized sigma24 family protein
MFTLRFFEGCDNPEIAQALGTSTASVAVTLSRTRDRLQQEFRSYMGEIR